MPPEATPLSPKDFQKLAKEAERIKNISLQKKATYDAKCREKISRRRTCTIHSISHRNLCGATRQSCSCRPNKEPTPNKAKTLRRAEAMTNHREATMVHQ